MPRFLTPTGLSAALAVVAVSPFVAAADPRPGQLVVTREHLLKQYGGTKESEESVAKGLAWLVKQQKKDGAWAFDNGGDQAAATGMALLPFLGAGFTHKAGKGNTHQETVARGVAALLKMQKADGTFSANTYANAFAVIALCEALDRTGDKALLAKPGQASVDAIQKGQGANGSWGYKYGDEGDTSVVGWQVQALHAARICKDLKVDAKVLERAAKFLDTVASKPKGGEEACLFGYRQPGPRASLTAVGLLCRHHLSGWGLKSAGLRDGMTYLLKEHPPGEKEPFDVYYYYYATQVARARGGDPWAKDWNPKMRDLLVSKQVNAKEKPDIDGSWDKDGTWVGDHCGRLGTTAFAVLTLEVYYRHLWWNTGGGLEDLDRK